MDKKEEGGGGPEVGGQADGLRGGCKKEGITAWSKNEPFKDPLG